MTVKVVKLDLTGFICKRKKIKGVLKRAPEEVCEKDQVPSKFIALHDVEPFYFIMTV